MTKTGSIRPSSRLSTIPTFDRQTRGHTAHKVAWIEVITPRPIGERSIVTSVSVCLSVYVCVCLSAIISSELHDRSSPNFFVLVTYVSGSVLIRRRSDTLCTSGFMDDVIFAHKPKLLDVAAQLRRSAYAALGLAMNCAQ